MSVTTPRNAASTGEIHAQNNAKKATKMKIFCPDCGKELLTIDTKFRKDGTKRRTRRCPACNKNWVSEVFEQRLGRSYIETENFIRAGEKRE